MGCLLVCNGTVSDTIASEGLSGGLGSCYSSLVTEKNNAEVGTLSPKRVADSQVSHQQLMMPSQANPRGSVHGGVIVKLADEAAGICAMRHSQRPCVTVAIDSVSFHSPVHVGEVLLLAATINYVGRTSMEIRVDVHAEDPIAGVVNHTNSALFVFVALGENGSPVPVPALILETEEQKKRWENARARQNKRRQTS